MLTHGEDVEAHALRSRGWTISAIARHLGRDRKTVRAYINGDRVPGVRARSAPDPLEPFKKYLAARFVDDPHVWASALYDEVRRLGYQLSYPSFARQVRLAGLRPHCEACAGVKGRDTIEIDHPAGVEIQWDWFERRSAPWGATAYVLLGTLPHSSKVRGVLAEKMDQPHLIEAIDKVLRCLGGTARVWRTDRLATVIVPGTRDVQPSFAPVAKHYGAVVEPCPPRRGNRKGAVESSVRFVSGRWWRTMGAKTPEEAQRSLDVFCATTGDERTRRGPNGARLTVGELADGEPLLALPPVPFPATTEVSRVVADNASVAFGGNRYSVPPGTEWHHPPRPAPPGISHHRRGGSVGGDLGHPSPRSGWIRCTGAQPGAQRGPRSGRAQRIHHGQAVRQEGEPSAGKRSTRRSGPTPRTHRT